MIFMVYRCFKISTLNNLFPILHRQRKPLTGEDQNIKHLLVCDLYVNNRLRAIFAEEEQYKLSKPKRDYARENEARESIKENIGADPNVS